MTTKERIEVIAKVSKKETVIDPQLRDVNIARGLVFNDTDYEVQFTTKSDDIISFVISSLWYGSLQVGDEYLLTYIKHKRYNELISFGNIIKELE